jgi:hypothetical protein
MLGDVIETSLSWYAVKCFPDRIEKCLGSCRQKKRIKDKDALSHVGAAIPILEFVSKVLVRSVTIHKYTPLVLVVYNANTLFVYSC